MLAADVSLGNREHDDISMRAGGVRGRWPRGGGLNAAPRGQRGRRGRRAWPPFLGMAVLLVLALPWYREPGSEPATWVGLPDWLIVAGLCFLGIAALNAWAWWGADWDDDTPEGD